ncbi:MAG: DUF2066 domain-containing protein [Methylophaga sp.]|nr:DUF2066 domain-containing protein [Methylophaga sp.]
MHRLFFVLISLLVSQSFAADVANLYQSQFPVLSQEEQERQKVAPEILQQVILKVVGDRSALDTVDISSVLAQTERLVQQYQYHRVNSISDDLTKPDQLEVLLSFDKKNLDSALTNIGLPIWSRSRPEVLIWAAVEEGDKRAILSADDTESEIVQALKRTAIIRGLPTLMPVMDLQDQGQVTFTDLWADFSETIESASQRYGSPVILMMKVTVLGDGLLRVNWHARINGESEQWQSRGDINTAIQAGIEELTDRLARRFSQTANNQYENSLTLEISDVNDYSDYDRIVKYLTNLQYVSNVTVSNLVEDRLTLNLDFQGDLAVLDRTLAIDRVLFDESSYMSTDVKNYRLLP